MSGLNATFLKAIQPAVFANPDVNCFLDQVYLKDQPVSPKFVRAIGRPDALATLKNAGIYNLAGMAKKDEWFFMRKNSDGHLHTASVPRNENGKYINAFEALKRAIVITNRKSKTKELAVDADLTKFLDYEAVQEQELKNAMPSSKFVSMSDLPPGLADAIRDAGIVPISKEEYERQTNPQQAFETDTNVVTDVSFRVVDQTPASTQE